MAFLAVLFVVGACGPGTLTDPPLDTDPKVVSTTTSGFACVPDLSMDHLKGMVLIAPQAPHLVTFIVEGGRAVHVRWPSGFRLEVASTS